MDDVTRWRSLRRDRGLQTLLLTPLVALLLPLTAAHASEPDPNEVVTFTRDVAPILQASCQACHNPQGMAPMSLVTYSEVRPWAAVIRNRVESRIMPPWHLDRHSGIREYKNDQSLTEEQIRTIARWVEGGAQEGDLAHLPPPIDIPDPRQWQLAEHFGRPPDVIIRSDPYTVKANSQDSWWNPESVLEIDQPRWVVASEFKPGYPGGIKVVHHGHAQMEAMNPDGTRTIKGIARHGVGKTGDIYPEGTGMRIEPGAKVTWDIHYASWKEDVVDDVVEVGLWLLPEGEEPRFETMGEQRFTAGLPEHDMPWAGDIVIPPHSVKVQQGVHVLDRPAVMHSYRAHMHMRGKEQSLEVIYPDGRKELLARTDNFDHIWQLNYQFADHVKPLLPKGSQLLITTVWDNTANNLRNPDPDMWVVFGQRGVDEMSHAWLGMTYIDEAEYQRLLNERDEGMTDR